MVKLLYIRIL